jgi:hypothetical protein
MGQLSPRQARACGSGGDVLVMQTLCLCPAAIILTGVMFELPLPKSKFSICMRVNAREMSPWLRGGGDDKAENR